MVIPNEVLVNDGGSSSGAPKRSFTDQIKLMQEDIPLVDRNFNNYVIYIEDIEFKLQKYASDQYNKIQAAAQFRGDIISKIPAASQLYDIVSKSDAIFTSLTECIDFIEEKRGCFRDITNTIQKYNSASSIGLGGAGVVVKNEAKADLENIFASMEETGELKSLDTIKEEQKASEEKINDPGVETASEDDLDALAAGLAGEDPTTEKEGDDKDGDGSDPEKDGDQNPSGGDDQNPSGGDDKNPSGGDDKNPSGGDDQSPSGGDDQNPSGGGPAEEDPSPEEKPTEDVDTNTDTDPESTENGDSQESENSNTESEGNSITDQNNEQNHYGGGVSISPTTTNENQSESKIEEKEETSIETSLGSIVDNVLGEENVEETENFDDSFDIDTNSSAESNGQQNPMTPENRQEKKLTTAAGVSMAAIAATALGTTIIKKKDNIEELFTEKEENEDEFSEENAEPILEEESQIGDYFSAVNFKNDLLESEQEEDER